MTSWRGARASDAAPGAAGRALPPAGRLGSPGTLAPARCPADGRGGPGLPTNTPTDRPSLGQLHDREREPIARRARLAALAFRTRARAASTSRGVSPRPAAVAARCARRARRVEPARSQPLSQAERNTSGVTVPQRPAASRASIAALPETVGGDWSCRSAGPGRCVRVRVRNAASVAGERSRLPAGRLDPAPTGGQPHARTATGPAGRHALRRANQLRCYETASN